jgi:pilus assembly protein CpaE
MTHSIYSFTEGAPEITPEARQNPGDGRKGLVDTTDQESQLGMGDPLSIYLIAPDDERRSTMADAILAYPFADLAAVSSYPVSFDPIPTDAAQYDAVVIGLDGDPEHALQLVENFSLSGAATVMVFSAEATPDKLMRSMRSGAREFLTLPVEQEAMRDALLRAAARRPVGQVRTRKGKLLTFMGAKGGVGVTTLACNFALSLAEQRDRKTILIDLAIPLGDAALTLGIQSEYSTVNALQSIDRLDVSFLSKLLVKHSSGLEVLPGPGNFVPHEFTNEAIAKLLAVARQSFDYVVVDAGSRLDLTEMSLFREASTIYLISQVGVAELRNSNRVISQLLGAAASKVEVVLNRHNPRSNTVPEDYIAKVLTKPARWKIPNDYASVQRVQIEGLPLVPGDSPIAVVIEQMSRSVTGQAEPKKKKRKFSLFG